MTASMGSNVDAAGTRESLLTPATNRGRHTITKPRGEAIPNSKWVRWLWNCCVKTSGMSPRDITNLLDSQTYTWRGEIGVEKGDQDERCSERNPIDVLYQ